MKDFIKHLTEAYDQLDQLGDTESDVQTDSMHAASIVQQASALARENGAGHLAKKPTDFNYLDGQPCFPILEAKTVIGQMRAWCLERLPQSEYLKVDEAAEFLNISPKTIYPACDDGSLKHSRFGKGRGTIRITREALRQWADANRTGPDAAPKDYLSD